MLANNASPSRRYEELDSLRGIAALTVVLFHALLVFIPDWEKINNSTWQDLISSPLRFLWSGHQAVMLFFLLSGFVLALPYLRNKQMSYMHFVIRRICRIYIPFIAAIMLAVVMRTLFYKGNIAGFWDPQLDAGLLLGHLFLIGTFKQHLLDPVVWSLVHEMRISLIFPLLMLFVKRYDWKWCLGAGLLLACVGFSLHYAYQNQIDRFTNYFDTLQFMLMFIVGALLAANRDKLSAMYKRLSWLARAGLFTAGFLLYSYSNPLDGKSVMQYPLDWLCAGGGAILLVVVLNEPVFKRLLTARPIAYLGKISYSLYLYHMIVYLTLVTILRGVAPIWMQISGSIVVSLYVAHFAYQRVEVPSMRLGKRLTGRGKRKLMYEQTYGGNTNI